MVQKQMPQFQVGDLVTFTLGVTNVRGAIVENRQPMYGIRGRRLYEVSVFLDPEDPYVYVIPGENLQPLDENDFRNKPLSKREIIDFLTVGGLVSMLNSNTGGNCQHLRVWLCRDQLGNVTYTFHEERGLVGGAVVPFRTLIFHKILASKKQQVLEFLEQFGLTDEEAEEVIRKVGTKA